MVYRLSLIPPFARVTRGIFFNILQGQLYVTGKSVCHLVVYTQTDLKIVVVPRDDEFIGHMVAKLCNFFEEFFKPAISNKIFYRDYDHYDFSKS